MFLKLIVTKIILNIILIFQDILKAAPKRKFPKGKRRKGGQRKTAEKKKKVMQFSIKY